MTTLNVKNSSKINSDEWRKHEESAEITKKLIKTINTCEKECISDTDCSSCGYTEYGKNCYAAKLASRIRKIFIVKEMKNEQPEKR